MPLALDPDVGVAVAEDAVGRAQQAGASAAKALHCYAEHFEVNFETEGVSLVRTTVTDTLSITAYAGDRKGSAEMTGRDHDGVDGIVARAVEAAQASEPDPANVLPTEAAEPAASRGDEAPDREEMVAVVARFVEEIRGHHPSILMRSSHYSFINSWMSYANSHGRSQHARKSHYLVTFVLAGHNERGSTSFQYSSVASPQPFADISEVGGIRQSLEETERSFDPRPVPATFVGDIVLTPSALASLVGNVTGALSGLALMKRTSPYLEKLGEQIAAPSFTLRHRPGDLAAGLPFDSEGFPNTDLDIVQGGVLENFLVDWYMSHKLDRPMTTAESNLEVASGDTALEDMIASTERGIVMGRYSGSNPNQALDFSGVAKNSFYVEGGKIVGPINETMVAGNLATLLNDVKAVSRQQIDYGMFKMPWLAAGGVTISTR
ncbi:MAG TPA: TldD/PmbA family protein [Acidimicrobiales bacterium]|jgi:PmbA protein|nr:TldD/PmbA family protein [Acidimicrobiales bacterium]